MIAQKNRFSSSAEVRRLYSAGRPARTSVFALRSVPTNGDWKLGVVVSKKVHKSAVVRNRIRRRVYEVARKNYADRLQGRRWLITVFDVSVAFMSVSDLENNIARLFSCGGMSASVQKTPKNQGVAHSRASATPNSTA